MLAILLALLGTLPAGGHQRVGLDGVDGSLLAAGPPRSGVPSAKPIPQSLRQAIVRAGLYAQAAPVSFAPTVGGAAASMGSLRIGVTRVGGLSVTATRPKGAAKPQSFTLTPTSITRGRVRSLRPEGRLRVSGPQVSLDLGALTVHYRSSMTGIEQSFTIPDRPAGEGPLTLSLKLNGAVSASQQTPGSIALRDPRTGSVAYRYDHLEVTDARHRLIPAHLRLAGDTLQIVVEDRNAVYPLTIDPTFSQQAELTVKEAQADDGAGYSVSISSEGNTALVGVEGRTNFTGAAVVFTRSGTTWTEQAKLTALGPETFEYFGIAVALSGNGNTAVIGAVGANGEAGAAYVFTRSGTTWTQQQELTPAGTGEHEYFGSSVALSGGEGNTALVGAYRKKASTGAAYVFTRSGKTWTEQKKLTAALEPAEGESFGYSVALSGGEGNTALVGAYGRNSDTGAAYVFTRSGTAWTQQQKLAAIEGSSSERFGRSVALSGEGSTALVGAYGRSTETGAAYAFTRSGTTWTQQQKLVAAPQTAKNGFGWAVALSGGEGNTALISATEKSERGAVYVFTRSGAAWTQAQELTASGGTTGEGFGSATALSEAGNTALIGADEKNSKAGAAYVFSTTVTTLVSSKNPSPPYQTITYTATVAPVPSGGTVAFTDNGITITGCGAAVVSTATGKATCEVSYSATGSHSIIAKYSGTTGYMTSTSATLTEVIERASVEWVTEPGPIKFVDVLNGKDQKVSEPLALNVGDGQLTAGWNITATSTTFKSMTKQLPREATTVNSTPTVTCDTPYPSCTKATDTVSPTYTLPAALIAPAATTLFAAAAESGVGDQTVTPRFTLTIPSDTKVATYASTWTLTLASGP